MIVIELKKELHYKIGLGKLSIKVKMVSLISGLLKAYNMQTCTVNFQD